MYITIRNWNDVTGNGDCNSELKIRISDHDLPPSYDGLHGSHDIDVYAGQFRPGNDGHAMPYYHAIEYIFSAASKKAPLHARRIIECKRQEGIQKEALQEALLKQKEEEERLLKERLDKMRSLAAATGNKDIREKFKKFSELEILLSEKEEWGALKLNKIRGDERRRISKEYRIARDELIRILVDAKSVAGEQKIRSDVLAREQHDEPCQKTPSHPWKKGFGQVVTNADYQDMMDNRELQIKAKQGDIYAARELVDRLVKDSVVEGIARKYPNAIVVPVPSMEILGKRPNAIPFAYARKFEKYGLRIDNRIVEASSAHHTGAKTFKRVVNRPHYKGAIKSGTDYIIVDDVFTMGGTINSLRNFIEDNGGNVVAVSTLTAGVDNIKTIAISDETLYNLKEIDKKGDLLHAVSELDIAENYEALTEAFGRYILKNREKILNEERSRRADKNSRANDGRKIAATEKSRKDSSNEIGF